MNLMVTQPIFNTLAIGTMPAYLDAKEHVAVTKEDAEYLPNIEHREKR